MGGPLVLTWAVIFLVLALLAAVLGLASLTAGVAVVTRVFLLVFATSLALGLILVFIGGLAIV